MAATQSGTLLRHIRKLADTAPVEERPDQQLLEDFAACRAEAAFATLVSRHGPMVLRVCRRVLHHEQDAEDAFQATFLVLAQNTASIRKRDAVGDWLYGLAYRTAMKAKRSAARRRKHEAQVRPIAPILASPTWDEVQAVLDEELQRLSPAFRKAFVLCILEGKSGAEAASESGCKEGTVKSRVNRARRLLQRRLARRGIELTALLAALSVAASASRAALPAALSHATVHFGLMVAAGSVASGMVPAHVAALAAGVTRAIFLNKAKTATALLLAVGVILASAGVLVHQALAAEERPAGATRPEGGSPRPALPAKEPPASDAKASLSYGGRVLGPDGRPVAGARLYLTPESGYWPMPRPAPQYATTGPDGRFQFRVSKGVRYKMSGPSSASEPFGDKHTVVTAAAADFGPGFEMVPPGGRPEDLTLHLVPDDVPITGQIVDLEGKSVPGVTITMLQINAAPGEDLGPWLEAVKTRKRSRLQLEWAHLRRFTIALCPQVTTDAEGRFRLTGAGRNRLVTVRIDGPTIASQELHILTRPGEAFDVKDVEARHESLTVTYYGANFKHVAAPTQPIVGIVRDRDTKRALAGATIKSYKLAHNPVYGTDFVETKTDVKGRYRLTGMPKGDGNMVVLVPPENEPYLAREAQVPSPPGLGAAILDFEMKPGIWIEGQLTDKATGKPVVGQVEYFALATNPHLKDQPGFDGANRRLITPYAGEDGRFRVVGLPGPGLLAVRGSDRYLTVEDRDDNEGLQKPLLPLPVPTQDIFDRNAIARIEPGSDVKSFRRDVTLDPGETVTGALIGPDGKPVAGALSYRLTPWSGWGQPPLRSAEFTVWAMSQRRPRRVLFLHREKRLVGELELPKDRTKPVIVHLQRAASVIGRLVDANGRPRPNVELHVQFRGENGHFQWYLRPEHIKTGPDGRFRVGPLLLGHKFVVLELDHRREYQFGDGLRSGETRDLGDVQLKRPGE
jgi:RNA polymerase sigma factor (sigma-70 family)